MYIAFISSEENIAGLDAYKAWNRKLALEPEIPESERQQMIDQGKVFVLATLSMHSSEVGPSQSAPLIAYDLLTTEDPKKLDWLDKVVYMMVPCHNPDGMNMIVNNYLEHKGTKYDGASLPRVYHKYVGHDNNRDFVILSQDDTKAIADIYNQTWFPQVMVEKHQMGSTGVRYFVPPNHDPIAVNVPAGIFNWSGLFGQNMAKDMTAAGQAGVAQHYLFDDYWPGSTETCIWKNVIGFLTEAASVRTASPVFVEPGELRVSGKGLSEYKKGVNMLMPWEGGWWRLGDIVDYEVVSTMSILKTAALHREDILRFRNDVCREMVELGRSEAPYYYIMPGEQDDQGELAGLVSLMREHGVEVFRLTRGIEIGSITFNAGDFVIPLAQPFRAFIKEVMEVQEFPERHYTPGGELIKPYDITTWSLPLHRNVKSHEVNERSTVLESSLELLETDPDFSSGNIENAAACLLPVGNNDAFRLAFLAMKEELPVSRLTTEYIADGSQAARGSFVIEIPGKEARKVAEIVEQARFPVIPVEAVSDLEMKRVRMPRIALVETYFHDMDAGWTRFVFDTYGIPFEVLRPHEIKDAGLAKKFDVVVFPDNDKNILLKGKYKSGESYYMGNYHPDFQKGMEKEGLKALLEFINGGGQVVAWGRSSGLFEGALTIGDGDDKEEFRLPFSDVSAAMRKEGLYVPGSLIRIQLLEDHPLTYGMPNETGVFSRGRPVFRTTLPGFDTDRRVIATFPEKKVLLSGYAAEEEKLGRHAAMVWLKKGNGELVLFGFNPQFRASTQATYKLLFNALLLE